MESNVKSAILTLKKVLKEDKAYRKVWEANIAMAVDDAFNLERHKKGDLRYDDIHKISTIAAENFINNLIK